MKRIHRLLAPFVDWLWYQPNQARWLLWPLSWAYRAAIVVRRTLYRTGVRPIHNLPVPVIVVGNISVGGTGKTPFVIWLASELQNRGYTVGVISRGYGGNGEEWPQWVQADSDPAMVGDEPVLIALRTRCPVVVGPDRVAAAERLLRQARVDVVISDDGLQHYRLGRNFEIAVVDGTRGLGSGFCLPAGPLREPPSRLDEVDAVIVNGGDWGHGGVFRADLVLQRVYQMVGAKQGTLEQFREDEVHAVAGIGNPQRFFELLEDADLYIIPHPLPDHVKLQPSDLSFDDPGPVMITEKDAMKVRKFAHENVWCVAVDLKFQEQDGERFMRRLLRNL